MDTFMAFLLIALIFAPFIAGFILGGPLNPEEEATRRERNEEFEEEVRRIRSERFRKEHAGQRPPVCD